MCRWSRIPGFLILAMATQATTQWSAPAFAASAPRGTSRSVETAGQARGARYAQGGYIAAPGVDLGLDLATGLAGAGVPFAPDAVPPDGPPPLEPPPPAIVPGFAGPPPCIRPKIIQVGRGLRNGVKTKVIYGAPTC